jgi:hypothetical protein
MHRSSWLMKSMSPCLSSAPMAGCRGVWLVRLKLDSLQIGAVSQSRE